MSFTVFFYSVPYKRRRPPAPGASGGGSLEVIFSSSPGQFKVRDAGEWRGGAHPEQIHHAIFHRKYTKLHPE